jgi:hypothetical protein
MKGLTGFLLGTLFGAAAVVVTYTTIVPIADPFAEIVDLRAHVDEQAREIESLRRDIAAQADLRNLGVRMLASPITPPKTGHPVSPPVMIPRPTADSPPKDATATSRRDLELDYADLIDQLGLTAARRLTFLDLLAHRDAPGSPAALRAFLPRATDYTAYQTYTRQLPDHRHVRELRAALDRIARPLTPGQETSLVTLFSRERKAAGFPADEAALEKALAADPARGPQFLTEHSRITISLLNHAATILTPEQLRILRQLRADEYQRLQLTVRMTQAAHPGA